MVAGINCLILNTKFGIGVEPIRVPAHGDAGSIGALTRDRCSWRILRSDRTAEFAAYSQLCSGVTGTVGCFCVPICRQCLRRETCRRSLLALNANTSSIRPRKTRPKSRRDPAFERLQSLLPVTLKLFTPSRTQHPITLHHDIWRQATKHARRRRAFILLMPPDVAWADGSFARLRTALEAGKRVMFMAYPRVVSETIVPAMTKQFPRAADQSATIPAPEMMALAMTHIHPLMAAYSRFSTHFPIHPEMILWPVEGDGFLLRLLARELFCFEPGRYPLNAQSLLSQLAARWRDSGLSRQPRISRREPHPALEGHGVVSAAPPPRPALRRPLVDQL